MVRRLKDDLREIHGGFPKRNVVQIDIDGLPADAPELRLSSFARPVPPAPRTATQRRERNASRRRRPADHRLATAPALLGRSVRPHACVSIAGPSSGNGKRPERRPAAADRASISTCWAAAVGSDDDRATLSEEELQAEEDAQVEAATLGDRRTMADFAPRDCSPREQKLLDQMTEIAEEDRALPDGRVLQAHRLDSQEHVPGLPSGKRPRPAKWNDTAGPHLHRIRRHEALPAPAARRRHRRIRTAPTSGSPSITGPRQPRSARRSSRPSTPTRPSIRSAS